MRNTPDIVPSDTPQLRNAPGKKVYELTDMSAQAQQAIQQGTSSSSSTIIAGTGGDAMVPVHNQLQNRPEAISSLQNTPNSANGSKANANSLQTTPHKPPQASRAQGSAGPKSGGSQSSNAEFFNIAPSDEELDQAAAAASIRTAGGNITLGTMGGMAALGSMGSEAGAAGAGIMGAATATGDGIMGAGLLGYDEDEEEIRQFGFAGGTFMGHEEVNKKRAQWGSRGQFVMVLMGYAIGIGNVWRFPYLCGTYGGGAFVVVYLICLIFVAFPLFVIELVIGQYYQKGPVQAYAKLSTRFKGLAYIAAYMDFWILSYYQMIIGWALIYWWKSFNWFEELPWKNKDTRQYFDRVILQKPEAFGAEHWNLNGHLVLALFAIWAITAACLCKGIHSAGKIAYFTVITPFILMIILFFRAIALKGAGQGLAYYLKPDLMRLFSPETWGAACGQILFSLSPATGAAIALASFNKKDYRHLVDDALIIACTNSGFSLFGGFVVFSVVGNLAHRENRAVETIAEEGPGLAFVVFPEVLAHIGPFFSWLFFSILLLLGLDSSFAWVHTLVTYIMDWLDSRRQQKELKQHHVMLGICFAIGLLGLVYCTRNGYYMVDKIDHFVSTYCLLFSAFLEFILFGYVVGVEKVKTLIIECVGIDSKTAKFLTESNKKWMFTASLKYVGPVMTGAIFVALIISDLFMDVVNPGLNAIGWIAVLIPLLGFSYSYYKFEINHFLHGGLSRGAMMPTMRASDVKGSRKGNSGTADARSLDNESMNYSVSVDGGGHVVGSLSGKGGSGNQPTVYGRGYPTFIKDGIIHRPPGQKDRDRDESRSSNSVSGRIHGFDGGRRYQEDRPSSGPKVQGSGTGNAPMTLRT